MTPAPLLFFFCLAVVTKDEGKRKRIYVRCPSPHHKTKDLHKQKGTAAEKDEGRLVSSCAAQRTTRLAFSAFIMAVL